MKGNESFRCELNSPLQGPGLKLRVQGTGVDTTLHVNPGLNRCIEKMFLPREKVGRVCFCKQEDMLNIGIFAFGKSQKYSIVYLETVMESCVV